MSPTQSPAPESQTSPVGPFSRPTDVAQLPATGTHFEVVATPEECAALAVDFDILGIGALKGQFHITPWRKAGVKVTGVVEGTVTQACVVTLDPVEQQVREEVELEFLPAEMLEPDEEEIEISTEEHDPPEPIHSGRIDLGILAAEFLALGLDPYPRKAGAVFAPAADGDEDGAAAARSPFAELARLRETKD